MVVKQTTVGELYAGRVAVRRILDPVFPREMLSDAANPKRISRL